MLLSEKFVPLRTNCAKMNVEREYKIPFKGLKAGVYTYDFKVDDSLFEYFESPEIKQGECDVRVELRRLESMLDMEIALRGEVTVECDRCLDDCRIDVAYEGNLVVKFSTEEQEFDGEVLWLNPSEDEVDLAQYIYESIVLSLPYQRVHPEGECNPEMTARFSTITSEQMEQMAANLEAEEEPTTLSEEAKSKLAALKAQLEQK